MSGMTPDEAFGRELHRIMWDNHIPQTQVANAMGIDQSTLSKLLRGQRKWTFEKQLAACDHIGIDIRDVLGAMWGNSGSPVSSRLVRAGERSTGLITDAYPKLCLVEFDGTPLITDPMRPVLQIVA